MWVYLLGWSCHCEIKPVNNKNRSNFNEENKKGTERKNTYGPNNAYLCVIWACASSLYSVPSYPCVLFIHLAWCAPKQHVSTRRWSPCLVLVLLSHLVAPHFHPVSSCSQQWLGVLLCCGSGVGGHRRCRCHGSCIIVSQNL